MAKAPVEKEISFKGFEDVKAGIVKWPMSVIRISAEKKERLIELADKFYLHGEVMTDEAAFILLRQTGNYIIRSLRLQEDAEIYMNLIWYCVTTLPQKSIRLVFIIHMQSCTISRKKILV